MKICVFGGTFSPIHKGHVKMVEEAYRIIEFDKILVIPTGMSYLKNNAVSGLHRFNMAKLAFDDRLPVEISDIEIKRPGASYTYETLLELKKIYPKDQLYLLIGEDSARYIDKWKNPDIIFNNAKILVAKRDDPSSFYKGALIKNEADRAKAREDFNLVKERLEGLYNTEIKLFDYSCKISSSILRKQMAEGIFDTDFLDERVIEYIKFNGLYQ